MIETLYIPTYRRTDNQLTYDYLPPKWQERSVLVVAADEEEILKEKGYPVLVAPCQGKGPEGANPLDYGLSPTRKWIAYQAGNEKYAVLDDDIMQFVYTRRPCEPDSHVLANTEINNYVHREGYEDYFEEMMKTLDEWLEDFVTCGLESTWNMPRDEDYSDCWRQTTNHFYNGKTFPKDEIDFTSLKCAQDYYILLQLLTKGYPNRMSLRYRVRPALTQAAGGCAEYRTLEVHNRAMQQLQKAFPKFVSLKTKIAKMGEWGGLEKFGATIQWKKAYRSSQQEPVNTLEELFG
jgi:hypothetical protein